MTKDKVIMDYIRGKISVSEARKLLNEAEGRRLVKIIDKKNVYNRSKKARE